MIIDRVGDLYHATFRGPSGRVYFGFGPTRSEAMKYCRELIFKRSDV